MKPFQQGDLDGLCGLYATINAVKLISKRISYDFGSEILLDAALTINKKTIDFIIEGTTTLDITRILRDNICIEFDIRRSKPFHSRSNVSLDEFWETLCIFLHSKPGRAAIIVIETSSYSHWTVVRNINNKRLILFDSNKRVFINRRQCSTTELGPNISIIISPASTFFLEKL
jgi:hypothetical protein